MNQLLQNKCIDQFDPASDWVSQCIVHGLEKSEAHLKSYGLATQNNPPEYYYTCLVSLALIICARRNSCRIELEALRRTIQRHGVLPEISLEHESRRVHIRVGNSNILSTPQRRCDIAIYNTYKSARLANAVCGTKDKNSLPFSDQAQIAYAIEIKRSNARIRLILHDIERISEIVRHGSNQLKPPIGYFVCPVKTKRKYTSLLKASQVFANSAPDLMLSVAPSSNTKYQYFLVKIEKQSRSSLTC
jgi:hypothetical protein